MRIVGLDTEADQASYFGVPLGIFVCLWSFFLSSKLLVHFPWFCLHLKSPDGRLTLRTIPDTGITTSLISELLIWACRVGKKSVSIPLLTVPWDRDSFNNHYFNMHCWQKVIHLIKQLLFSLGRNIWGVNQGITFQDFMPYYSVPHKIFQATSTSTIKPDLTWIIQSYNCQEQSILKSHKSRNKLELQLTVKGKKATA